MIALAPLPTPPAPLRSGDDNIVLADGRVAELRPIAPADAPAHREFMARLAPEDVRFRFFRPVRWLPESEVARLTAIDPEREMAIIATVPGAAGGPETLGVARAAVDPGGAHAEFAIIVRSDLKRRGLGQALVARLAKECLARGIPELRGQVLRDNRAMLRLAESLGATRHRSEAGPGTVEIRIALEPPPATPA